MADLERLERLGSRVASPLTSIEPWTTAGRDRRLSRWSRAQVADRLAAVTALWIWRVRDRNFTVPAVET